MPPNTCFCPPAQSGCICQGELRCSLGHFCCQSDLSSCPNSSCLCAPQLLVPASSVVPTSHPYSPVPHNPAQWLFVSRASRRKYHRGLDHRNLPPHRAGGCKSKIKVSVGGCVWQVLSPWLADDCFLARSSHGIFSMPSGERPLVSLPLL